MSETLTEKINFTEVFNGMEGWCTPEKADVLFDLVIQSDAKLSVELGVFGGRSLLALAFAHREKGSGFAIGVDPWKKEKCVEGINDAANNEWWEKIDMKAIYNSCQHHIEKNNIDGYCDTMRMTSEAISILLPNGSVDVLHQDSNHSEDVTCKEVQLYAPKIKRGGFWISDDTTWETTQKSISMLLENGFEPYIDYQSYRVFRKV